MRQASLSNMNVTHEDEKVIKVSEVVHRFDADKVDKVAEPKDRLLISQFAELPPPDLICDLKPEKEQ